MAAFIFWTYFAFTLLGMAATVYSISKPREPMSSGVAAGNFLISALLLAGVYYLYTH
jgi:hypothetical protein